MIVASALSYKRHKNNKERYLVVQCIVFYFIVKNHDTADPNDFCGTPLLDSSNQCQVGPLILAARQKMSFSLVGFNIFVSMASMLDLLIFIEIYSGVPI